MISPASTNTTFANASLGLIATGSLSLGIAFALWLALLAFDGTLFFFQVSRHMHQTSYHAFSFVGSGLGIACCYSTPFFLGAFLAARPRWSFRPGLSALLAYGTFLTIYLPSLDWSRGFSSDTVSIIIPLITSPIGGLLGERLFAKTKNA